METSTANRPTSLMAIMITLGIAFMATCTTSAVNLPFYDGFDYAEGNLNAVSGGNWAVGNGSTSFEIAVSNSAPLIAPAGFAAASGKGLRRAPSGTARRSVLTFPATTATDGNVLYISFLLNVVAAPAASQIILHVDNSSGSVTSPDLGIFVDNGPKVGVGKNSSTVGFNMATNLGSGTHLIVARYRFQTGNDAVDLWVDPSSSDYGALTSPAAMGSSTNSGDPTAIGFCQIVTASSAGGSQYIDEFRIGTTWAEVVPTGSPVTGEKLGFTTQPANAAPSATMSPVVVQIQNAGGASATSNGVPVTLALTAGSGTLSGTLTQNTDASGKATFSNLSINTAGAGKQLTATASGIGAGLTAATSATFSIVAPSVATQLAFTTQPGNALTNTAINSIVVQIRDASSVNVASNGVPITLTLTTGAGALNGATTQNTDGTGKATFTGLSIDTAGAADQLTASASGIGAGLADALSATFAITNGAGGGGAGGDLYITTAASVPTGFRVQGTNNTGGIFTQILGASSPDASTNNWIIVNFQNGDVNGLVTFTNPVSPALPSAFYKLRTGNTVTKLEPPSIGIPPVSQIVSPGATATFTVTATGPVLQYLWFFNGNPISGAASNSLVIPNAQAGNVGNYYVAVANPAGNVNSAVVTLGVGNVAPTITSNPANQTNNAGGTAIFNVTATGTSPLSYQWYFNNTTPLAGKTSPQLLLSGITTNSAGNYRCTVTNAFGSATSANASLTVNPVPTALPDTNMVGFAAVAGVTGGTGGTATTVSNYTQLRAACRAVGPIIIQVDGVIVPTGETYCYVEGYDKTIVGIGTNSGLAGYGFRLNGTNIIIQNMSFTSTNANSDGVTIDNSSHGTGRNIWVDHCTFYACTDGSLDVTKGADYVTVSWCKFSYEAVAPGVVLHEFVNLIGSSDSDVGDYHVTVHHNWYGEYCRERMPSVRFGRVHCFNNYYDCVGNNYCVRTRINAQVLVENNYFIGVQNPWERFVTSGTAGLLKAAGNVTNSCTFVNGWVSGAVVIPGNDVLTDPSLTSGLYPYTLTTTTDVPYYIQTYSGNGKYPYVP